MTSLPHHPLIASVAVFLALMCLGLCASLLIDRRTLTRDVRTESVLEPDAKWGLLMFYALIGVALALLFSIFLDMPLVGVALLIGASGMGYFQREKARQEALYAFEEELPSLVARWSNDMAGSMSLPQAVEASFADAKPVVRPVLSAILPKIQEDPVAAFQSTQARLLKGNVNSEAFPMLVAVVSAGSRTGRLGPALRELSATLQEIENLKLQLRKDTESGARTVTIMVVAGLVIAVLLNVVMPPTLQDTAPTLTSQMILVAAIGLMAVAWVTAYVLSRSKV